MKGRGRGTIGWVTAFVVTLHTILLGILPLAVNAAGSVDPFSVICHSAPSGTAQGGNSQDNKSGVPAPSQACDHCKLCSTVPTPDAPDGLLDFSLAPTALVAVLYPVSVAPVDGIAITPKLARGPPQLT